MNNDALNSLVNGIGALGEMAGMLVDSLSKNGFTRAEAISITKDILVEMIKPGM